MNKPGISWAPVRPGAVSSASRLLAAILIVNILVGIGVATTQILQLRVLEQIRDALTP